MRRCEVYMHGIKAGVLTEEDNRTFCFTYDKAYLLNEKSGPVSLTLPLQAEPYRSNVLFPVFANMLSEGENRQIQSQLACGTEGAVRRSGGITYLCGAQPGCGFAGSP